MVALKNGEETVLRIPVSFGRHDSNCGNVGIVEIQGVAVPELYFSIFAASHEISSIKVYGKNVFMVSFGDGFDRFASGESPDHDISSGVSGDDHVVGSVRLHRYDTSGMSNKGRVQKTLGSEIPNPSSPVCGNRYQAVALEMDPVDYIGMALFRVV